MTYKEWIGRGSWLVLVSAFAACGPTAQDPNEGTGRSSAAVFTNGGFEVGTAGMPPPAPWIVQTFLNPNPGGVTIQNPQTRAGLNLMAGGNPLTTEIAGMNQPDPDLGLAASLRYSRYGNQCARVNFHSSTAFGNGNNVNSLSQTMTIGAGDVDMSDGQVHVRFAVAPVLQHPSMHTLNQQPYYFVQLTNVTQANAILYSDFNLSGQPGVPWKTLNAGMPNEINYTDWQLVDIAPGSARLAMNDMVKLEIIGGGCALGGHFGEVYVDGGLGANLPGLFVSGTGPAQTNTGTSITYTLTYHNGSAGQENGVVIDFTMPPGTNFKSIVPPAGATCVTPAMGTSGTIVCTFTGPVLPGAFGSFQISVNVTAPAPGTIVAGTYDIHSVQETPLLGNHIITTVGCTRDTDCAAGNWCHESAPNACLPTLPNGTVLPSDPGHVNPTLNGMCSAVGAGALVCTSGVCDTDNRCGLLNKDGPCTVGNGGTVCRSGVCDPDLKCGLANGDGPCTVANGPALCRSGVCDMNDSKCGYAVGDGPCTLGNGNVVCRMGEQCSMNGTCEPTGGCNVDADCSGGNWCSEGTHTCTAKIANGGTIPTDPPHMGPALNGMCTVAAGTLVCASGVCDTADQKCGLANGDGTCTVANGPMICRSGVCDMNDGKCGYASGDGPCTMTNGGTVCRSGVCSTGGTCEPMGGCNVDADCTGGNWCNETAHMCTPPLANGTAIPTDGAHANPTLNGMCTAAAGMLVCQSGVCDTADNKCGFANGDGPCTMQNGGTVCRSGACGTNGNCTAPTADAGNDSGSPADSGGPVDSGGRGDGSAQADGGASGDGGTSDDGSAANDAGGEIDDTGTLAGGGINCAVGSRAFGGERRDTRMTGGALAGLVLLAAGVRRRRRSA